MKRFLRFLGSGIVISGLMSMSNSVSCLARGGVEYSYSSGYSGVGSDVGKRRPVVIVAKKGNSETQWKGLSGWGKFLILLSVVGLAGSATCVLANASDEATEKTGKYVGAFTAVAYVTEHLLFITDLLCRLFGKGEMAHRVY